MLLSSKYNQSFDNWNLFHPFQKPFPNKFRGSPCSSLSFKVQSAIASLQSLKSRVKLALTDLSLAANEKFKRQFKNWRAHYIFLQTDLNLQSTNRYRYNQSQHSSKMGHREWPNNIYECQTGKGHLFCVTDAISKKKTPEYCIRVNENTA